LPLKASLAMDVPWRGGIHRLRRRQRSPRLS